MKSEFDGEGEYVDSDDNFFSYVDPEQKILMECSDEHQWENTFLKGRNTMAEKEDIVCKAIYWIEDNIEQFLNDKYPLEALYKMPFALALGNKPEEADRVYRYLRKRFEEKNHFYDDFDNKRSCDIYYDFWIIIYAKYINDPFLIDLYKTLLKSYNADLGAFNSRLYSSEDEYFEIRATAIGAISAFLVKDDKVLLRCSEFLINAYSENKVSYGNDRFYFLFNAHGKALSNEQITKVTLYYKGQESVLYYSFYLASIALSLMFIQSGDRLYLEFAERYISYFDLEKETVKFNSYSGKLAFSCALLFVLTDKNTYLNLCEEVISYLQESQVEDGSWRFDLSDGFRNEIMTIDRTSEFSAWIRLVSNLLKKRLLFGEILRSL